MSATTSCSPTRASTPAGWRRWPASTSPVTVAVDSDATLDAAARGRHRSVLIDVNVGLPRCGIAPEAAGRLADRARRAGFDVRGVMGYEGHLMMVAERDRAAGRRRAVDGVAAPGARRRRRRDQSAPAAPARTTCTDDRRHRGPGRQLRADGHPLRLARPPVRAGAVRARHGDLGQRRLGRRRRRAEGARHGPRQPVGDRRRRVVLLRRARHVRAERSRSPSATGSRVVPAHVDPTMAMHEAAGSSRPATTSIDRWPIDLRGW